MYFGDDYNVFENDGDFENPKFDNIASITDFPRR